MITFLITFSCFYLFPNLPLWNHYSSQRPLLWTLAFIWGPATSHAFSPLLISLFCFTWLRSSSSFLHPLHLLRLFQAQIKIQMLNLSAFPCLFWAFLAIFTSQYAFFFSIALETKGLGEFTCLYGNRGTQRVRLRRLCVGWKKKK